MLAVKLNWHSIVSLLIEHPNTDINAQGNGGCTALMLAASHGQIDIIDLLLNHPDIDLNVKNVRGDTALMIAKRKGYKEIIELLLVVAESKNTELEEYKPREREERKNEKYDCPICLEKFNEIDLVTLKCGDGKHKICYPCISEYYKSNDSYEKVKCPYCRAEVEFQGINIEDIGDDYEDENDRFDMMLTLYNSKK